METVIDQAGRIVLPKPIRDALGLLPGTKVNGRGHWFNPGVAGQSFQMRMPDSNAPSDDVQLREVIPTVLVSRETAA